MTPHYADDLVTVYHGDCLDVLRELPEASVDAVVTDPPYGLGFMGKEWDKPGRAARATSTSVENFGNPYSAGKAEYGGASYGGDYLRGLAVFQSWCEQWAAECLRVLKPGGHMLAFGGTRTWHRLACAVEDAGFEIRDSIAWLYGSGFPKSLDVSKAIDKAAGAEREVVGTERSPFRMADPFMGDAYESTQSGDTRETDADGYIVRKLTAAATDDARRWRGWGTALKPAHEPIVVARKPLAGTVAANVLRYGTGGLNIDATRIDMGAEYDPNRVQRQSATSAGMNGLGDSGYKADHEQSMFNAKGRWPANVTLDEHAAAELDRQSGERPGAVSNGSKTGEGLAGSSTFAIHERPQTPGRGDTGGASRFFYVAKAPTAERPRDDIAHPTVKPLDLMRWLVRLVCPPGGTVLDPFLGSGTTAEACIIEGFHCIGVEREADYLPLIVQRLTKPIQPDLFGGAAS